MRRKIIGQDIISIRWGSDPITKMVNDFEDTLNLWPIGGKVMTKKYGVGKILSHDVYYFDNDPVITIEPIGQMNVSDCVLISHR